MSDEQAPAPTDGKSPTAPAGPAADVLDGVAWDFDPEDEYVSPLVATERYFRDFPWMPEDEG